MERLWNWILFNLPPRDEFIEAVWTLFQMVPGIAAIFAIFLLFSALLFGVFSLGLERFHKKSSFDLQKTVKFGDASSITSIWFASVGSVFSILFMWGLATGSVLLPVSLPTPFVGQTQFEYTAINAAGDTDTATVVVLSHKFEDKPEGELDAGAETGGFALNDSYVTPERRRISMRVARNDDGGEEDAYRVTQINGQNIEPETGIEVEGGIVYMLPRGSLQFRTDPGWTMDPLYLPPPEKVWSTFVKLNNEGYQGIGLWEHLFWSLYRVILGMFLGALFGIPLGYAMGLSSWLRSWFDPVVEFMRPIPPLALIPLIIIWFGIGEQGKIVLLFLAALWIMTIAARSGVAEVNITKIHAAYSLGTTKRQLLTKVVVPNSLPQIFTGARVAMGVCWGTVVAAELVAAEKGIGKMIIAASKFQLTDIVIVGIIIIGVVGMGIEVLMRKAENRLVPWKGRA
ncbi:MAG: ABC transporter permease [Pseudomonadota bacterium]